MLTNESKLWYNVSSEVNNMDKLGTSCNFLTKIFSIAEEKGINKAEIGRRIGASRAYVSKLSKRMGNLTIETMLKLCQAVGRNLEIKVV